VLKTVESLIRFLNDGGIRYCHWKSNWVLSETLLGETDLDLLVHQQDARRFRSVLRELGFEPSIEAGVHPLPSVEHHHALDEDSGSIVHVHAYYRVVTGQSLSKNYRLPLEEMLLSHPRRIGIINVPSAGAELIVFVLRMLVKHTSIIELVMVGRDWSALHREAAWFATGGTVEEATELLGVWLPGLDSRLFRQAFEALRRPAPLGWRIVVGLRVRRRLKGFVRKGVVRAQLVEMSKFVGLVRHRLAGSKKKLTPAGGGAVIAFVGSEATGKSTLLGDAERWLGQHYTVRRIHSGKPPPTWLTSVPQRLLPFLRALLPSQRSMSVGYRYAKIDDSEEKTFPLLFGIRSVMLAYERRALLIRAFRQAANGSIVLCDRYPSSSDGAPDSPQLAHLPTPPGRLAVRRRLSDLESRLYREIPRPDLVIHLTAPLDVTLARNAARAKTEPEEFVRFRHPLSDGLEFPGVPTRRIDTDRPFETIVTEVRKAIWWALYGDSPEGERPAVAEASPSAPSGR
jgi:thymidylate kinase